MPNLTSSQTAFNSGVTLTRNDAAASQTIDMSNKRDEGMVIVARNDNTTSQTATIAISPGDFDNKCQGTLSVDVGPGASAVIGPLEGMRFKNSASQIVAGVSVTASGTVSNVKLSVIKLP